MCRIILSLTFLSVLGVLAPAQQRSAPPPPPPAKLTISGKWESSTGGFKISFPSPPTKGVRSFEGSFGPTNIQSFALSTAFAYYAVTYFDFPTAITDKYDLDTRFDLMRDEQSKRLSARVMQDSAWMFGTHYGRENVLETEKETVSMRSLVAGPRMFVIFVITKGRQSSLSGPLAAANVRRVNDFFNSFEITRLPKAAAEQVKLPADFQVTATVDSFRSDFLGISLTPPPGWVSSDQNDSEQVMEMGKEEIRRTDPRLADYLTSENTRVLALYSRGELSKSLPGAMFFIFAEQTPYPNFTPIAVARTYEKLYVQQTEKITKPISTVQLGGREFAWIETFDPKSKLYHRIYVANVKGMALEFSLLFTNPEDADVMIRAIQSIRFSE